MWSGRPPPPPGTAPRSRRAPLLQRASLARMLPGRARRRTGRASANEPAGVPRVVAERGPEAAPARAHGRVPDVEEAVARDRHDLGAAVAVHVPDRRRRQQPPAGVL